MVSKYLPLPIHQLRRYDPDMLKFLGALVLVRNVESLFASYEASEQFTLLAMSLGLEVKSQHTVVERWPCRLGPNASKEEFDRRLASGFSGVERYVEWKRAG